MKQERFEDELRKRFEERTILPSSEAWERLEKELKRSQPQKKKRLFFYTAAAAMAVLLIATFFLNQSDDIKKDVVIEIPVKDHTATEPQSSPVESKKTVIEDLEIAKSSKKMEDKERIEKSIVAMAQKDLEVSEKSEESVSKLSMEDQAFIDKWAQEIAAALKDMPSSSDDELAAEVENLLKQARQEQFLNRLKNNPEIDATALLEEVEWELDRSFKERIFDFLGNEYDKIRMAIALKLE